MTITIHFPSDRLQSRNDALFARLVRPVGACESLAGEILRAANRIAYRWYNDGDELGRGYGNETCNPAARFLEDVCGGLFDEGMHRARVVTLSVDELWRASGKGDERYSLGLVALIGAVVALLEHEPSLFEMPGADFWDWADPELDVSDECWDEDGEEW